MIKVGKKNPAFTYSSDHVIHGESHFVQTSGGGYQAAGETTKGLSPCSSSGSGAIVEVMSDMAARLRPTTNQAFVSHGLPQGPEPTGPLDCLEWLLLTVRSEAEMGLGVREELRGERGSPGPRDERRQANDQETDDPV